MSYKIEPVTEEEWLECNEFNRMIIEEFLQQQHLSDHTLKQYTSSLKIFARWVKEFSMNKPIYELKPRDALKYQNFLLSKGLSANSVAFKRSSVSSLCNYIELYYGDDYPLFRNIYSKAIPTPQKELVREKIPLTKEEYNTLVKELEKRKEWQMLAFLKFTYSSGCRKGEVIQLKKEVAYYNKVKDKEGKEKNYYQTHDIRTKGRGKQGKVRKLRFDEDAKQAMLKWLKERGEDDEPMMFVRKFKSGKVVPLKSSAFNRWCSEVFSEILGREIWVHLIRSTRATHLAVDENKDIKVAQALLGHQDSSTTEIYVVRDDSEDVDDAFD